MSEDDAATSRKPVWIRQAEGWLGYGYLPGRPRSLYTLPSPPLDNIQVMVIVWRLRGNIVRTALCWIVWHNVHSPQHTYMSSSYRSNRLSLSHWNPYAVRIGGCLELYYCNMVEWFWWDSSLILTTNSIASVLWHCWFGHPACKNRPRNDLLCMEWDVKPYTLTHPTVAIGVCWRRVIGQCAWRWRMAECRRRIRSVPTWTLAVF